MNQVRELIDFIQDDDKLREERKKAKKNKDKYIGMSSEAMGMRVGANVGGFGSSNYDNWDSNKYEGDRHYSTGILLTYLNKNYLIYLYFYYFIGTKSSNHYEDDYTFDGEREDSDTESSGPPTARY